MTDERLKEFQDRMRKLVNKKKRMKQILETALKRVDEELAQTIAEFERELEQVSSK